MVDILHVVDVLIVEDNEDLSGLVRDFLLRDGYSCEVCGTGEEALAFLQNRGTRIVLLDIMLPGLDGFAVCDEIHKRQNIPLIMISACSSKDDQLSGLRLGADDYIEKPFDMDILRAKIAALYRRHYSGDPLGHKLVAGDLEMDAQEHTAFFKGQPVELSPKEFDLLFYLAQHNGKTLHKETLMNAVWGVDCLSQPNTLQVHIKHLREKIEGDNAQPEHILTAWGVGYKYEE